MAKYAILTFKQVFKGKGEKGRLTPCVVDDVVVDDDNGDDDDDDNDLTGWSRLVAGHIFLLPCAAILKPHLASSVKIIVIWIMMILIIMSSLS